jgi:hypothetical protein
MQCDVVADRWLQPVDVIRGALRIIAGVCLVRLAVFVAVHSVPHERDGFVSSTA